MRGGIAENACRMFEAPLNEALRALRPTGSGASNAVVDTMAHPPHGIPCARGPLAERVGARLQELVPPFQALSPGHVIIAQAAALNRYIDV